MAPNAFVLTLAAIAKLYILNNLVCENRYLELWNIFCASSWTYDLMGD